jgi:hypothetical protein
MSSSSEPKATAQPPEPEHPAPVLAPGRRMTDPQAVEPGPEGEWPIPASTPKPGSSNVPGPAGPQPVPSDGTSEARGLVDPRPEAAGPEIVQ